MSMLSSMQTNSAVPTRCTRPGRARAGVALCIVALFALAPVQAADIGVDPVSIELTPDQQTASVTVSNQSDQPASIQIQAVAWTQRDGNDVYTPAREMLVSPPIMTIGPKKEQVIRLALRRKADPTKELAYRIYLQELPQQPTPGFTGLQFALRIGLPVFVKPQQGNAAAKMAWGVARMPDQRLKVTLRNDGNAHVQVSDFTLYVAGTDKQIAGESGSTYVLAGQTHEWLVRADLPATIADGRVRLQAYTDAGNIDTQLPLQQP